MSAEMGRRIRMDEMKSQTNKLIESQIKIKNRIRVTGQKVISRATIVCLLADGFSDEV